MRRLLALALGTAALLTACTSTHDSKAETDNAPEPSTLRVLASSELSDMTPVLDQVRKDTGIAIRPTYMGTLDAVDLLAKGKVDGQYDALWLSSNDYLRLRPDAAKEGRLRDPGHVEPGRDRRQERHRQDTRLDPDKVTWSQLEQAVQDGRLTYGMTDPARSNSGFSTLVSVASALSGAQSALTDADVTKATPG